MRRDQIYFRAFRSENASCGWLSAIKKTETPNQTEKSDIDATDTIFYENNTILYIGFWAVLHIRQSPTRGGSLLRKSSCLGTEHARQHHDLLGVSQMMESIGVG